MQSQAIQSPSTERELALELACSVRTLQTWRAVGKGPEFMKVGSAVRYSRAAIDAYKASITHTSTSAVTVADSPEAA